VFNESPSTTIVWPVMKSLSGDPLRAAGHDRDPPVKACH
jgi:hypothetical protein